MKLTYVRSRSYPTTFPVSAVILGLSLVSRGVWAQPLIDPRYVPADRLALYDSLVFDDARGKALEMFVEWIPSHDPRYGYDLLPDGTILLYQTNVGRFGKAVVARQDEDIFLRWTTYERDGQIASQGIRLELRGPYTCDLDTGTVSPPAADADFHWNLFTHATRALVPRNGARFTILGFPFRFSNLPPSLLQNYPVSRSRISDRYGFYEKEPFVYRTSAGRFGKIMPYPRDYPSSLPWAFVWVTYNFDRSFQSYGSGMDFYSYRTGWHRVERFDLDAGFGTLPGDPETDFYRSGPSNTPDLYGANGTLFAAFGEERPDVRFETIDTAMIRSARLSPQPINGSDDARNRIPTNCIVLYETAQGRLGKMKVVEYGRDLVIAWRTFNTGTSSWSSGSWLVVPGTRLCDLDAGLPENDFLSASADFWWRHVSDVERYLEPRNGARFVVLPTVQSAGTLVEQKLVEVNPYLQKVVDTFEAAGGFENLNTSLFGSDDGTTFVRGDVDGDGAVTLDDSQRLLEVLAGKSVEPPCQDAADVDDDGDVDSDDALFLLSFLGSGSPQPPAPFPECGVDPTADTLSCLESSCEG